MSTYAVQFDIKGMALVKARNETEAAKYFWEKKNGELVNDVMKKQGVAGVYTEVRGINALEEGEEEPASLRA